MKRLIAIILMIIFIPFLTSCHKDEEADIYVSLYPLQYITESIVKDNMKVKSFYPYGTDIHDYEPAPAQIINMSKSKAIFYIGAGLEAFIEKAAGKTLSNDILVQMSNYLSMIEPGVDEHRDEEHSNHNHPVDPHVWLDPNRMIIMAEKVCEKVSELMPERAEDFITNKNELVKKLVMLDNDYKEKLSDPSITDKIIVVDHDAYLYLSDAYGIKRIKTRLDNDSCTVIPTDFIKNIEIIKNLNIKYITKTSNESSCDIVGRYVEEAKLEVEILYSIETISKDDYEAGKDYIFFMRENLKVIDKILPRNN